MLKKIAVTGPESTGKSALCEALARHFNALWVSEYARAYIAQLSAPYTPTDIENIARGQIEREAQWALKASHLLFCDTELLVIKIWFENAFGYCPQWILDALNVQEYDLYLLCDIDLPWVFDPMREHPHHREYFFEKFKRELELRKWPYVIVSATGAERANNAIDVVEKYFEAAGFLKH